VGRRVASRTYTFLCNRSVIFRVDLIQYKRYYWERMRQLAHSLTHRGKLFSFCFHLWVRLGLVLFFWSYELYLVVVLFTSIFFGFMFSCRKYKMSGSGTGYVIIYFSYEVDSCKSMEFLWVYVDSGLVTFSTECFMLRKWNQSNKERRFNIL